MENNLKESLLESLEMNEDLLPYVPRLLKDLWDLGGSPDKVVDMLRPLNLEPDKTNLLDLGCGKGAVTVTVSNKLGFSGLGIDACKEFLEEAKQKALEYNVSDICKFEFGDIRKAIQKAKGYDIVVYASLGNILGGFSEIVTKLRQTIRIDGYMIIDDGFLKNRESVDRKGYEHYRSHEKTLEILTSHGDKLVEEVMLSEAENHEIDQGYLEAIKKRVVELVNENPKLEELINDYIRSQEEECDFLEKYITGSIWLLQRVN